MIGTHYRRAHRDRGKIARVPYRWSLVLAILLALACFGRAEAGERWADLVETVFQNFGREQGLSNPVPIAFAQDGSGFIWIGTQGGLSRWDGYRFRNYPPGPVESGNLPDSWIQTLHTDTNGRLWVGTTAGGLARYDPALDRFATVPLEASANGRVHIGSIADDGSGGLWIGTDDGLNHLDPATGTIATLRHDDRDPGSLPSGKVHAILRDRRGRLWIGTTNGLARRGSETEPFTQIPLAASGDTIPVTALIEDTDGRIWIGTRQHGAYVQDANSGPPRAVVETDTDSSSLPTDTISALSIADGHQIWMATRGGGIVAVDTITGQTRRVHHDRTLPSSLANDDVWALLLDQAGSMWVGSTGGLSYHAKAMDAVSTIFGASDRATGLSEAAVYAVLPTADGRVWLGYLSGGIDIIDPMAARVTQLRPDATHPETALPKETVTAMAEAASGEVYIATPRGLYRADTAGHGVTLMNVTQRDPHTAIYSLFIDAGVLWIGGLEDGLWGMRLDGKGDLVFGPTESKQLTDQSINTMVRGSGQDLWVGTLNGLNRIDLATGTVERILPDPADPISLPGRSVSSLLYDRQNRLWAATFGGGIGLMTGRSPDGKPQFRHLGVADGLPHINIDTLLPDLQGRVWAGTDDGLAVIDPTTLVARALHRVEGSALADYFANAGAVDTMGEPLFGADGGLSIVRAERLRNWDYRPPIVVSDVRIGGNLVPAGGLNSPGAIEPLVLTPDGNSLAVEFSALDFTAPERNRYAYRLEGFDRNWIETDASRRLAAYTNLPPGSYTLRLRGSNRDGVWTERDLAIPIRVLPTWYQTLWFMIAACLAALAMVAALVRSRTAYLHRRQAGLERQIADRTADLRAANERLFELATVDPLTGCANRRHFVERANDLIALSRRLETPISLAIMDLDKFKSVNDTYGHPAGDEMLRMIGRTGESQIRASDLFGRIGGEEFALLMPNTTADNARQFAERLREAIGDQAAEVEGTILRMTVSLGLAELRTGENFDKLYARADAALYTAKETGRNRVIVAEMV